ncbi:MAG TPA: hypothetical protein VF167_00420 [Longimicrobiaceae bacterium]
MTRDAVLSPRALKRPLHRRALALVWALLFLFGTGREALALHPCPHHGGRWGGVVASEAPSSHQGHHGSPVHSHAEAGDSGRHTQAPEHAGPCTCGSACQASGAVALPGASATQPGVEVIADLSATILEHGVSLLPRPSHFLPFAQAPPV